jgi:hypothetical protein
MIYVILFSREEEEEDKIDIDDIDLDDISPEEIDKMLKEADRVEVGFVYYFNEIGSSLRSEWY